MPPLRFLLTLLCLTATATPAQQLALPPLANEVAAKFPAVGRLGYATFDKRQGCTGTLIAPDLVLTAAHCVSANGRSGRVFVAGWTRGEYIASRKALREIRHPDYAKSNGPKDDVALVYLDSPMNEVAPIPLGTASAATLYGTEVALLGYHRQTPHLLSGDFACAVGRFTAGLLQVGCPVINGNSGAPLLDRDQTGAWQVVGVVSAQLGASAIAVELPDWVKREVAAHLAP